MRIQALLVALIATSFLCSPADAAPIQDGVKFGRGRLLRKWRDDLVGKTPQTPESPTKAQPKKGTAEGQNQRSPTPADPRQKQTDAEKLWRNQNNKPATKQTPATSRNPQANIPNNRNYGRTPTPASRQTAQRQTAPRQAAAPKTVGTASRKPAASGKGFGMRVKLDKDDSVLVTHVDRGGNAAEAGIQRGDFLTEIGGAALSSLTEYEEISKLLGEGDQIEFQYSRRGKKKEVNIQYGETPTYDEENESKASAPRTVPAEVSATDRYDFVPKRSNSNFQSVLEQPKTTNPQATPFRTRQPTNQLSQTVEQQRQQIEQMQRELQRLRQNKQPSQNSPSLNGPSLSGPGN